MDICHPSFILKVTLTISEVLDLIYTIYHQVVVLCVIKDLQVDRNTGLSILVF